MSFMQILVCNGLCIARDATTSQCTIAVASRPTDRSAICRDRFLPEHKSARASKRKPGRHNPIKKLVFAQAYANLTVGLRRFPRNTGGKWGFCRLKRDLCPSGKFINYSATLQPTPTHQLRVACYYPTFTSALVSAVISLSAITQESCRVLLSFFRPRSPELKPLVSAIKTFIRDLRTVLIIFNTSSRDAIFINFRANVSEYALVCDYSISE